MDLKIGTKVRVIKYGHIIWYNLNAVPPGYKEKVIDKFPEIYFDKTNNISWRDINPGIVGREGIVDGFDSQNRCVSLSGIPEKHAWYNPTQLEII